MNHILVCFQHLAHLEQFNKAAPHISGINNQRLISETILDWQVEVCQEISRMGPRLHKLKTCLQAARENLALVYAGAHILRQESMSLINDETATLFDLCDSLEEACESVHTTLDSCSCLLRDMSVKTYACQLTAIERGELFDAAS